MKSGSWASFQSALPPEARAGGEPDEDPACSCPDPDARRCIERQLARSHVEDFPLVEGEKCPCPCHQEGASISPEQQVANVQAVLLHFFTRLYRYWGVTMREAERAVARGDLHERTEAGRRKAARIEWLGDAYAAVGALRQWRETKRLHAAGNLPPLVDDGSPF